MIISRCKLIDKKMASTAVGLERASRITGYQLKKGNFSESTPNLPMKIILIGEANEANQASLSTTKKEIISAQQAGELYGFGSPIHMALRILKPVGSTGVGGIPIEVIPQAKAVGATAKVITITPVGTATKNGTHTLVIAGREGLEGSFYDININEGDTQADITAKIEDAINAVLGCPVSATSTQYVATATTKWNGLTANDITITVKTGETDLGITYAVSTTQAGSGTPSISSALSQIGNDWAPILLNTYGAVSSILNAIEAFNGIPDQDNPTGRYASIIMKPLISFLGSTLDDPTTITDSRKDQVTHAVCPAPGSAGHPLEAAANMVVLAARCWQDTPHLDVSGKKYPDMPTPESIGSMADYDFRDAFLKKGSSTVDLVGGRYEVQDFVTTYHPVGETPPQFSYCRNLVVDFNVRFSYYLKEQQDVVDHVILNDDDISSAQKVVKPKTWKGSLSNLAEDLEKRALIVDSDFMTNSIVVNISATNPDRLETSFSYKRSGYVRIASTTAEAGFNFGSVQ